MPRQLLQLPLKLRGAVRWRLKFRLLQFLLQVLLLLLLLLQLQAQLLLRVLLRRPRQLSQPLHQPRCQLQPSPNRLLGAISILFLRPRGLGLLPKVLLGASLMIFLLLLPLVAALLEAA
jgi:hypothetical protein